MSATLDASTPAKVVKSATGNTATTASFTAPGDARLLAFWEQDTSGACSPSMADSGGLTWTLIARLCVDQVGQANTPAPSGTAQSGYIGVWTAVTPAGAGSARTVTVTQNGAGGTGKEGMLSVKVFTDSAGAPTIGAVATAGGTGLPSRSITTTAANSNVWAGSNDWNAGGTGTAGSGQTIVDTNDTATDAQHVWRQTSIVAASGTSVTMNLTGPASQIWNMAVIELVENASGGPATVSGSDSASVSDSADTLLAQLARSDAASMSDVSSSSATAASSDSASMSDTSSSVLQLARNDSGALADSSALQSSLALSAADSSTLSDVSSAAASVSAVDSSTLGDSSAAPSTLSAADSASVSDSANVTQSGSSPSVAETFTLSDGSSLSASVNALDSSTLSDSRQLVAASSRVDSSTLSDSGALQQSSGSSGSDTATQSESTVQLLLRALTFDAAALSELASRSSSQLERFGFIHGSGGDATLASSQGARGATLTPSAGSMSHGGTITGS